MRYIRNIGVLGLLIIWSMLASCEKNEQGVVIIEEEEQETFAPAKDNYLVFGHFYGFCPPPSEWCIEIFQLDSNQLWEDQNDNYPSADEVYQGDYVQRSTADFNLVADLVDAFPMELLDEPNGVIGYPDATDGGGLYIEYKFNGDHGYWLIDNLKPNIPTYLHDFRDIVQEKIWLID